MRRILFVLISVLGILFATAFSPVKQTSAGTVTVIDRNNHAVTQLIDGNQIRVQVNLSQPASQTETINFLLDGFLTVGSCVISSGNSSCASEPFYSLGWYWNSDGNSHSARMVRAITDTGETIGETTSIAVSPRPVVMVHGFVSNWETWKPYLGAQGYLATLNLSGFAIGDGQVPGTLNTGDFYNPITRTNTIAQNAEILGQYISGVKQKTGAEMVDLVVHSMGGMISRYYIDRVMQDRDVAQLIMLGSPMGGSDCAVLPAALGFYLPASIEIRESYMRGIFNQQITHRHGIEFFDLGGTAITDAFKSPCAAVPNDTAVSFPSINAITLQSSKMDVLHSDLTTSQQVFQNFVQPLLIRPAGTFLSAPDPAPAAQTESSLEFTRIYTGHVDAGSSTSLTINIDANVTVASFALYDSSRSLTTIVRGASGNIIQLDSQTNGFIQINDPSSLFYLGYGFANPKPGPWNVTLQATDSTPSTGADFSISVYFVGGATLEATSSTLIPQPNEAVQFNAKLSLGGQPLKITSAQALIRDQDNKVETVNFPTGTAISTSWMPKNPGTYAVDIVVTGTAPDGSTVERTSFLAVEVQPTPSKGRVQFNLGLVIGIVVLIILVGIVVLFSLFQLFRRLRGN